MGFEVTADDDELVIDLTGLDRVMNARRMVRVEPIESTAVTVMERGDLEPLIDHRSIGFGTHNGAKRPGGRRVGTMLGRGVRGSQFWAVGSGEADEELLVLTGRLGEFARVVVQVDDPHAAAAAYGDEDA